MTSPSGGSYAGVYTQTGPGTGFAVSAPSDPATLRTLIVHVGGYFSSGLMSVTLSDNSAGPFSLTTPNTSGKWDQNFFITFQGVSPGATANVVWTLVNGDNITLNGVALSPATQ